MDNLSRQVQNYWILTKCLTGEFLIHSCHHIWNNWNLFFVTLIFHLDANQQGSLKSSILWIFIQLNWCSTSSWTTVAILQNKCAENSSLSTSISTIRIEVASQAQEIYRFVFVVLLSIPVSSSFIYSMVVRIQQIYAFRSGLVYHTKQMIGCETGTDCGTRITKR